MIDSIENNALKEGRKEGRKEALSVSLLPARNRSAFVPSSARKGARHTHATLSSALAVTLNGTSKAMQYRSLMGSARLSRRMEKSIL